MATNGCASSKTSPSAFQTPAQGKAWHTPHQGRRAAAEEATLNPGPSSGASSLWPTPPHLSQHKVQQQPGVATDAFINRDAYATRPVEGAKAWARGTPPPPGQLPQAPVKEPSVSPPAWQPKTTAESHRPPVWSPSRAQDHLDSTTPRGQPPPHSKRLTPSTPAHSVTFRCSPAMHHRPSRPSTTLFTNPLP
jgi:hypothetical protein